VTADWTIIHRVLLNVKVQRENAKIAKKRENVASLIHYDETQMNTGYSIVSMTYFDSSEPFSVPGVADLDRVYRFAWHEFTENDWESLGTVYRALPGWAGNDPMPLWFGHDMSMYPHLTASVEPPGLQVTGLLPKKDFDAWHEEFMTLIRGLPALEPN